MTAKQENLYENVERIIDPRSHIRNVASTIADACILDYIVESGKLRPLTEDDQFTKDLHIVELEYSGNPPTMAFKGFTAWKADVGAVSEHYAVISFREPLTRVKGDNSYPRRVSRQYRIFVFDGDLVSYFEELSHFRLEGDHEQA